MTTNFSTRAGCDTRVALACAASPFQIGGVDSIWREAGNRTGEKFANPFQAAYCNSRHSFYE